HSRSARRSAHPKPMILSRISTAAIARAAAMDLVTHIRAGISEGPPRIVNRRSGFARERWITDLTPNTAAPQRSAAAMTAAVALAAVSVTSRESPIAAAPRPKTVPRAATHEDRSEEHTSELQSRFDL